MTAYRKINTALCSFGMSGKVFHAPFLSVLDGFQLYAIWERSKKQSSDIYPGVISYNTYQELLEDASIELVVVNTPNYTHYEYAKKALESGKHVIVEKPFTVTVAEGQELIALAKQKQRLLSVYHNRRFDSDYKIVKSVVEKKLLGDLVEVEFHFDRYREALSPKLHKESPVAGSGALYDLGSHLIDQALQLFGKPQSLFADIRVIRPDSKVDDYFELLFYYTDLRVRLKCSYLVREALPAYILHGRKGSFIKAKSDIQESALQSGLLPNKQDWGVEPEEERGLLHTEIDGAIKRQYLPAVPGNYGEFYQGVFDAIRYGKRLPIQPEEALDVITIITKAFESNEQKKVIAI
ncbi:MAG TPA: Gfo/Idh/MocA family oxidoreductase [Flavisolibacter sp.]|nr:Gfo/Idh/MocA family oxidoreductase [Flavisolibacter sp.]